MIYLPILIPVLGISALLLMIALDDLYWYRNWARKRMVKQYRKDLARLSK